MIIALAHATVVRMPMIAAGMPHAADAIGWWGGELETVMLNPETKRDAMTFCILWWVGLAALVYALSCLPVPGIQ